VVTAVTEPDWPPTLVVFGAGGDLTARLLLPGLAGLVRQRQSPVQLVGSGREHWDDE
jgi:glucose-6-phosphate 1-dehydrogenase